MGYLVILLIHLLILLIHLVILLIRFSNIIKSDFFSNISNAISNKSK